MRVMALESRTSLRSVDRRTLFASAGALVAASAIGPNAVASTLGNAKQRISHPAGVKLSDTKAIQSGEPLVFAFQEHTLLRGAEDIHIHDDHALIPCRAGHSIATCDISDPARPRLIASFQSDDLHEVTGLSFDKNLAVASSSSSNIEPPKLIVLDAQDPARLRQLGSVEVGGPGFIYKSECHDGICFVTHLYDRHLYAVDIRNPSLSKVIGSLKVTDTSDRPFSIHIKWPFALVGTYTGEQARLVTVDLSDPTKMKIVNVLADDPDYCTFSGTVRDGIYYTCSYSHCGIFAFDVSDFRRPEKIGRLIDKQIDQPGRCVVNGDRAYLPLVHGDGVAIVDIKDPRDMKLIKVLYDRNLMTRAYAIAMNAPYVYVGARDSDCVSVFDTRNVENGHAVRSLYE